MDESKVMNIVLGKPKLADLIPGLLKSEASKEQPARRLLVVPDARLRQKSEPVKEINEYVCELAQELLRKVDFHKAIGFAAPQFGEMIRLFVIRYQGLEVVMANPEIVKEVGTHWMLEGCRSIPGREYSIKRPKVVKVRGLGLDGRIKTVKGHDTLAAALCHEIDHLNGILVDVKGVLKTRR
jgi:peptide deformylase